MTPMQQQYNEIKQKYPNEVVFFRLGDFYEAFEQDAKDISRILGITLTGRGKGEKRIPMAGIPYHALDNYLPKLVKAGRKVVIVDQVSEPEAGKLVEREVSKVFTAGTLLDENTLEDSSNNYLAAILVDNQKYYCAIGDLSTGSLLKLEGSKQNVLREISRIGVAELIYFQTDLADLLVNTISSSLTIRPKAEFELESNYQLLNKQFKTNSLKGFGIGSQDSIIRVLGALIIYAQECHRGSLEQLRGVQDYQIDDYMKLDSNTIKNLELLYPISGDDYSATVFGQLNHCSTSMGKRMLRDWLIRPLINSEKLIQRWDAVGELTQLPAEVSELQSVLNQVPDIERVLGRVGSGTANARDLIALKDGLLSVLSLSDNLQNRDSNRLRHIHSELTAITEAQQAVELIESTIKDDPAVGISDGGLIKEGFNSKVDELRSLKSGGKRILSEIQARESAEHSIPSLKVSYNKVFGYYIEVTKTHSDKVPDTYIRKQTLTNSERYITQELKEWEDKILNAESELYELEYNIFIEVRNQVAESINQLLYFAQLVAELDVYTNFAVIARARQYCKPKLADNVLKIVRGRHIVVEEIQKSFTPNGVEFDNSTSLIVLTGPNMSGKSTYIRQVALIVLIAQAGGFVPADTFEFELVDRIFTRVGAADNLSKGESTFMVEMNETANILNNATSKSLVILDEVGRGTSTFDGVAIAWSIIEYIQEELGSKTLFATHYHELIELSEKYDTVDNYNVEVTDTGKEVKFLHKISKGSASKSYGIHVAKIAGVPEKVTSRAEQILHKFENSENTSLQPTGPKTVKVKTPKHVSPKQLGLLSTD